MGYGIPALRLTNSLYRNGFFKNFKSVMELGSQEIIFGGGRKYTPAEVHKLTGFNFSGGFPSVEAIYKSIGFETYKCIDSDGRYNALVFDLNQDIVMTHGYSDTFDLLTNHGTTEHCFDQLHCFQNIHNLCAEGGIMIHVVPTQGGVDHGFYSYHPKFFTAMAASNNYEVIGMWIIVDEGDDLFNYTPELMTMLFGQIPTKRHAALFAALRKKTSEEFKVPWDPMFVGFSQLHKNTG